MSFVPVVLGVTSSGVPLCQGVVVTEQTQEHLSEGTSTTAIHHVSSSSRFEAESWSGEHATHEHEEEERRMSLLEDQHPAPTGDTPIASSDQFERKRTASLAAALLEGDPQGVALVHFVHHGSDQPFLEAEEDKLEETPVETPEADEADKLLSQLLFTLRELKMSKPDKHSEALQRLKELEEELRVAGAVTPADPQVSDAVARALAAAGPGRDIQIRVNQSRHTTTTKTVYETETPGMVGLDAEKIRELQKQMIDSLTSGPEAGADAGTTQKKETAEEGFTNEDGSVIVSKKMTRVVTTTKTTMPGDGERAPGE